MVSKERIPDVVQDHLDKAHGQNEPWWWAPGVLLSIGHNFEILMNITLLPLIQLSYLVLKQILKLIFVDKSVIVFISLKCFIISLQTFILSKT